MCTNLWLFIMSSPHMTFSISGHAWVKCIKRFLVKKNKKTNPFVSISVTVAFTFSVYCGRKRDESLIHPSLPPLCLLWRAVSETGKSGVKEGVKVKGNWRWQIIVWNWKSCREDVAVGDEVAQCFSNTPNTTGFHIISSFPLTSTS